MERNLTALSLRGEGKPEELSQAENEGLQIASELQGNFSLGGGEVTLKNLTFGVPGARVTLNGTYGLKSERMNFAGLFQMEARVSEAFTGWKAKILRFADPLFEKHGFGAEVAIHIGGTRENPLFGVDLFHKRIEGRVR